MKLIAAAAFALVTMACATTTSTPTLEGVWLSEDGLYRYTFNADGSVDAYASVGDPVHGGGINFPAMTWRAVGASEFEITSRWWETEAPQTRRVVRRGDHLIDSEGDTWLTVAH